MNVTEHNGRITSASIFIEDHGLLTLMLQIEDNLGSNGFGGYQYDFRKVVDGHAEWSSKGCSDLASHVRQILTVFGVDRWESVGGYCRVLRDGNKILAVGHIVENKWWAP